jgi:prepilin-type N-terminal cleavage/methylation domain-containing protein
MGLKHEKGFSLTELAIALSIVGALSAIGFAKWQTYRLEAIRGEAIVHLSELFAKMQVFRARYLQYFGDWRNVGFEPKGDLHYRLGFWINAGGASPAAPLNYRGPGAPAGTSATNTNSANACGGNCW